MNANPGAPLEELREMIRTYGCDTRDLRYREIAMNGRFYILPTRRSVCWLSRPLYTGENATVPYR